MEKLAVLNIKGEKVNDITLNSSFWTMEPNDAVLYDAIVLARASLRQGTHAVKNRSEVSGGGKKPWRQKGTGRARHGSTRSPIWTGGGVVFGPTPERNYTKKQNKKERRLALKSALAYKAINSEIIVVDNLILETAKTKEMKKVLDDLKINEKVLIVVNELNDNLVFASRNLPNILLLQVDEVNVLDVVSADKMVITVDAVKALEEVLG